MLLFRVTLRYATIDAFATLLLIILLFAAPRYAAILLLSSIIAAFHMPFSLLPLPATPLILLLLTITLLLPLMPRPLPRRDIFAFHAGILLPLRCRCAYARRHYYADIDFELLR